jgi:hypothetical protein
VTGKPQKKIHRLSGRRRAVRPWAEDAKDKLNF